MSKYDSDINAGGGDAAFVGFIIFIGTLLFIISFFH